MVPPHEPSPVKIAYEPPPSSWHAFRLESISSAAPNSFLYTLQAINGPPSVGCPSSMWHVDLRLPASDTDGFVVREYTPVSTFDDLAARGRLELLIKLYSDGKMSRLLAALSVGSVVEVSRPKPTLSLPELDDDSTLAGGTHFVLVAGGTGITPMYQLVTALVTRLRENQSARLRVSLLNSNHTHADVLLLRELDVLAKEHGDVIHVGHTLTAEATDVPAGFLRGRIDAPMLASLLPTCNLEGLARKFIVCGPQPMMDHVRRTLADLGYSACTELEC